MGVKANKLLVQGALVLAILFLVNIVSSYVHAKFDLTEDKRYTLTDATESMLEEVPDIMFVRVLLDGNFPAGFKRLQTSVVEMLESFRKVNSNITFQLDNPTDGNADEVKQRQEELAKDQVYPTNLRVREGTETQNKLIYPYALVHYGNKMIPVNLLENAPEFDQETNLNNSIALLEYKLANAIDKIQKADKPIVAFTTGHGELSRDQTQGFEAILRDYYQVGRLHLDSIISISQEIAVVIVARPTGPFSEKEKFVLDQYIMNGGKVMFFIEPLRLSLDSVAKYPNYIPQAYELNLDDMFFKYGCRINSELVLDLECSRIPQVIGMSGGKPQIELFPWYYHPLISPDQDHPATKNIDRVNLLSPTTIDTLKTKNKVNKYPILQTSEYTRTQLIPVRISFDILKHEPDPAKYDKGPKTVGLFLEGEFTSLFENRVTRENEEVLASIGAEFKESSEMTRIMVVTDGDLPRNHFDPSNGRSRPLGFNKWENFTFKGNQDLLLNSMEYLLNPEGILNSRAKDVKLRLLNTVRSKEEMAYWQFFNLGIPLIFIALFGVLFNYTRRRRYTKQTSI